MRILDIDFRSYWLQFPAKFQQNGTAWLKTVAEPGHFKMTVADRKKNEDGRWVYKLNDSDGSSYDKGAWVPETALRRTQGD